MCGMGADVAAFMITVQNKVKSGQLVIRGINAHHMGKILAVVQFEIRFDDLAVFVFIAVDPLTVALVLKTNCLFT